MKRFHFREIDYFCNTMKQIFNLLLPLILLHSISANAQITIQSTHLPSIGDTIRYSIARPDQNLDLAKTGANVQWDFTKLSKTTQGVKAYKTSAQTPYVLSFGFNAIGYKIADSIGAGNTGVKDVYGFFRKTSSVWENVGLGLKTDALPIPITGKHTSSDIVYKLPMTYKDSFNNNFRLVAPIGVSIFKVGDYFQFGNRKTVVDGYGTISTPYAKDVACIRVKSEITQTDSISVTQPAPTNFGFATNRVEYQWISTAEKIPMLEIVGQEFNGNFVIASVQYRDIAEASNPAEPTVDFVASSTTIFKGEQVEFTNISRGDITKWQWDVSPNAGVSLAQGTPNSKDIILQFDETGKYTISLKATSTSGDFTKTKNEYITVTETNTVSGISSSQLKIFPQPANQKITFSNLGVGSWYVIQDIYGKTIAMGKTDAKELEVDTQTWPSATYFITIQSKKGSESIKFVVTH